MRSVIFDLDGTLLDSLGDIAAAANLVLVDEGYPAVETEAYRNYVGEGVDRLFEQAIGTPVESKVIHRCMSSFDEAYLQTWDRETRPYDGIPELLQELNVRKIPIAVVSNKPHPFTLRCIDRFLSEFSFDHAYGQSRETPKKPDPTGVLRIAREWGIAPSEIAYVGDTPTDVTTAMNASMNPIGVSWGFRQADELVEAGAARVIGSPARLLDHLGE